MSSINSNTNDAVVSRQEQMRMKKILKMNTNIDTAELKSPRKRAMSMNNTYESPSKKFKEKMTLNDTDQSTRSQVINNIKRKVSSFALKTTNVASTPKSKPLQQKQKQEPLNKQLLSRTLDDEKIQRNLSKSWVDMVDDLAEQETELNEYINRVREKYNLTREEVLKTTQSDVETLKKRQKLINYGKVTQEYKNYTHKVARVKRHKFHPRTPNKFRKCSRRKFDGLIKKWRKQLHTWDDTEDNLEAMMCNDQEDVASEDGFNYDISSIGNGSSNSHDLLDKENATRNIDGLIVNTPLDDL